MEREGAAAYQMNFHKVFVPKNFMFVLLEFPKSVFVEATTSITSKKTLFYLDVYILALASYVFSVIYSSLSFQLKQNNTKAFPILSIKQYYIINFFQHGRQRDLLIGPHSS
jgi:hypothetical protein